MGRRGDISDVSAEILFQYFLQEALVSSSGMVRDVHSLILSIQHFLCRRRRRPFSKVSLRMVLERLSWRVTCPNHASSRLLSYQKRFLWTHKKVDMAPHPVVSLVLQVDAVKFHQALGFESLDSFFSGPLPPPP